ncbi:MAG: cytochrome c oxidase assembly protein [Alphaproteobacteria bacterium]|nr:cytochrome c oxidase assembly protein [Alphaproteobacteria bacterium]
MTEGGEISHEANKKVAMGVVAGVVAMVCLAFAAVPAYRAFCQVTGWGGTTQRAATGAADVLERRITVRFDGTVGRDLPWTFRPEQMSQTLHVGETGLAFFEATNGSSTPLVGRATFNVSPAKAGQYFNKIECFCFTEQTLKPGETVSMPVTYFVDPKIADDRNLDEVETITLAYTFFRHDEPSSSPKAEPKGP